MVPNDVTFTEFLKLSARSRNLVGVSQMMQSFFSWPDHIGPSLDKLTKNTLIRR
jgi:hypothetical protein